MSIEHVETLQPNITALQVMEFHSKFGHPITVHPYEGSLELRILRAKLILEEAFEFIEACGLIVYDPEVEYDVRFGNLEISQAPISSKSSGIPDLVEMADALGDLDYVVQGANIVFGFPNEEILREIHRSNMSKLGEDGKPIKREDGKILKGPNYFKPDIAKILERAGHQFEEPAKVFNQPEGHE